jgi:spore germination protein YaaH
MRRTATGLLVALALILTGCAPKRAANGWIPYWESAGGRAAVDANRELFSEVSPFWFRATGATTIASDESAGDAASIVAVARSANLPLVPAVRDGTPARAMAAILADPAQRAAHVRTLVNLAVANGYAGLELDYEQIAFADGTSTWPATRPRWVQFVAELGAALHANAKLLTVTVPPVYNGTRAPGSGYWVYDWAGLAPSVDRLRIMAYDYSFGAPGPIAPLWWVNSILAYAVRVVPPAKIQIAVPTYGRSWVTRVTGICPAGAHPGRFDVRANRAAALAREKRAVPVRDPSSGEMTFSYVDTFTGPPPPPPPTTSTTVASPPSTARAAAPPGTVTCQVSRTVYYPDPKAVLDRAALVGKYGIAGISEWALGFEDRAQWQPLRDYVSTLPRPGGADPIGRVEAVKAGARQVVVGGWALDPEADLPIAVTVTVGGAQTRVLARNARQDVATAYTGAGPFHGFSAVIGAPPGRQTVCIDAHGLGSGAAKVSLGCVGVGVAA